MKRTHHAEGTRGIPPTSDSAHVASAGRVERYESSESPDSFSTTTARQALQVIEGETKAAQYLARVHCQQADIDELAVIVSMLYGAALRGFCRVLAKTLGVQHG